MGLLTNDDANLYKDFFKENARLLGISVKYAYPLQEENTNYSEIKPKYSEFVDVDAIFEENPRVKTLKRLGWVSETDNSRPYVIKLPFDLPHLQTKALILIPPFKEFPRPRVFEVTEITTTIEYPDCWYCKLVPVVDDDGVNTDYRVTNYNKIRTKDQPDKEVPQEHYNYKYIRND